MPAALPYVAVALSAAAAGGSMIQQNQQTQHAKGAAEAQNTAMQAQLEAAKKADINEKKKQADTGSSTTSAAMAALRASMSASSGFGGTLLSGPGGAAPAPTSTKTLLGL